MDKQKPKRSGPSPGRLGEEASGEPEIAAADRRRYAGVDARRLDNIDLDIILNDFASRNARRSFLWSIEALLLMDPLKFGSYLS